MEFTPARKSRRSVSSPRAATNTKPAKRAAGAATLSDVAREVGVAAMTASVVLNGARSSTRVSEETRARILEVAARLRYRPNAVARGLSRRRMDTIGVVANFSSVNINLYFLEVLNGILQGALQHEQNATVFSISDWKQAEQRILQCCDGRVDGMIFIAPQPSVEFLEGFRRHLPLVTIQSSITCPRVDNLDVDNEGGACAMVRHLISIGHKRIAHLAGPDVSGANQRAAGYRRALQEAGAAIDEDLILMAGFDDTGGRHAAADMIERFGVMNRPTAVFCVNDAVAAGCLEGLAAAGLRVPEDISVAGFDDLLLAKITRPQLTTMRQPFPQIGRRAVEALLGQIAAFGTEDEPVSAGDTFQVELVERGSVAPPPAPASPG